VNGKFESANSHEKSDVLSFNYSLETTDWGKHQGFLACKISSFMKVGRDFIV